MHKKTLKIVSFRMNKQEAIAVKRLLHDRTLHLAKVYRAFSLALLNDTDKVLDFLEQF